MTAHTLTSRPPAEWHMGSLFEWHVDGAASGGAVAIAEAVVPPGGEPPLHVHAREDEIFYVLEGEVLFQRGTERIEAAAGAAVVLPRGVQHGFAVRTPQARMLVLTTPAGLEQAFRACSEPTPPDGPPSEEAIGAVTAEFARHGVTFVGPPLPALLEPPTRWPAPAATAPAT